MRSSFDFKQKLIVLAVAIQAVFGQAVFADSPRGIVTFTFDDANLTQYEEGLRLASEYNIRGTIFVPTYRVRGSKHGISEPWKMDWEQLLDFVDAGWEIGAHGRRHLSLPRLEGRDLEEEIWGPLTDIERELGVMPVSFSSPFGHFDDRTIDMTMLIYSYHLSVSWDGHGGRNPIDKIDPRNIGRMEVLNTMSSAEVCGEMVNANLQNKWLVLLFHGLVDRMPESYEVHVKTYEEILACAARLERAGVIEVLTTHEAMDAIVGEH